MNGMRTLISSAMVLVGSNTALWAQSAAQDKTAQEFDGLAAFMVKVMTGPASKILAMVFLIVGIWKIVNKDYGTAVGCVLALLALVFMPQLLNIF